MFNNMNDEAFDSLLTNAFEKDLDNTITQTPSDEELAEKYPVSEKSLEKLRYTFGERDRKRAVSRAITQKAVAIAAVFCVTVSAVFIPMLKNDSVEATVEGYVIDYFNDYVTVNFAYSDDLSGPFNLSSFEIGYIPEGYILKDYFVDDVYNCPYYKYQSEEDPSDFLLITVDPTGVFIPRLDTNNSTLTKMTINGLTTYISTADSVTYCSLVMGNRYHTVKISGCLSKAEIVKIAKSINIYGKE